MLVEKSRRAQAVWNAVHFEILDSGFARLGREWNEAHLRPPFSRLYYITRGAGRVRSGGEEMDLLPGQAYLLPAGLSIQYECPREMDQLYFHISVRTSDGYDLFSRCQTILAHPAGDPLDARKEDYLSEDYLRLSLLQCQIKGEVCRFIAEAGLEKWLFVPRSPFLEQVFSFVQSHLRSSLTVGDVAGGLALSESALSKRFRREFGIPLGRYMDEMLVREIGHLLAVSSLTIGEIADQLGFCDQFYLARFFRAREGITPSEYRARLREQV